MRIPVAIRPWFVLAKSLDRLADDLLDGCDPSPDDSRTFTIAVLFLQVHKSFGGSLLLAERGLPGDANAVLRSAAEATIALHALEADPGFTNRLIGDHFSRHRKQAAVFVRNPDYTRELDQADRQRLEGTAKGADASEHGFDGELREIRWDQVAEKCCPELYNLIYRPLSTLGTHVNPRRMDENLKTDEHGAILGRNRGPTTEGLDLTLQSACMILLHAARVAANMLGQPGLEDRLRCLTRRWGELADQDRRRGTSCDTPQ